MGEQNSDTDIRYTEKENRNILKKKQSIMATHHTTAWCFSATPLSKAPIPLSKRDLSDIS